MKSDTNQVRQVLMNELGLTRELVRGMAEDIVHSTLRKRLADPSVLDQMIRAIVREELRALLFERRAAFGHVSSPLETMIRDEASKEARAAVKAALVVTVRPTSPEVERERT